MTWTKQHDVLLCREVLVVQPFQFRHGTHDRGQCWERIANNLNLVEHPHFIVDQRSVRDRFTKLEKDFKRKKASEERASGISPEEPDELDQALEDITETAREQQEQLLRGEVKKKNDIEKEKETAEAVRKRAMERMGETRERENVERERKKKRHGGDTVEYLKEKRAQEVKKSEKEFELKKRDLELKEKMQEEEIKMRRKEQEIKEREQLMRERELEARLKKDDEVINILRQQLQQQQAILEEVQQQNKLLLSLYQSSLEKKE
eukprot:gene5626-biopygen7468